MCIVCQSKEVAKFQEQAIEALAKSLEEMFELAKKYCPFAIESERLAAERAARLLTDGLEVVQAEPEERSQRAPRGIPDDLWHGMPDEMRAVLLAAAELGGNVQVIKLSDMLNEIETKH